MRWTYFGPFGIVNLVRQRSGVRDHILICDADLGVTEGSLATGAIACGSNYLQFRRLYTLIKG